MKCTFCKNGTTRKGKVTVTLDHKLTLVIVRDVPAHVCTNCGHYFLDSPVTKQVLNISKDARNKKTEIEITKFHDLVVAA